MTMVKSNFLSSRKLTDDTIALAIDYKSVDAQDVYGFYLTNKTVKSVHSQLPEIGSFVNEYPDFLALDTEPHLFHKTPNTGICWFIRDSKFDVIDGLYNAIIYKNTDLLKHYKQRYQGIKFFIPLDYSTYGDFDFEVTYHNIKRSIITYLWFTFECGAIAFPLMSYSDEESLRWCFEHIMIGSNVAVSLKGVMRGAERELFLKALKVLVDTRHPKALVVYSVAQAESTNLMLKYAIDNHVNIHIINNTLQERNLRGK
ncbi:MAG: DUF4417 domain-containing protein [Clostridia bacterium]|nr:DUF4417 domain-containing protein [Clostridia bacterium]